MPNLTWNKKEKDVQIKPEINIHFEIKERFGQNSKKIPINNLNKILEKGNWHNLLFLGDNKLVLKFLLNYFKEKIDLIYFDPPFATGGKFNYKIIIGENSKSTQSKYWIRKKAYDDYWAGGIDTYLNFIYERLLLMKELLLETGSIYIHLDWHISHYVKILMDEIFGIKNFRNEIIWHYPAASAKTKRFYVRSFDVILFYTKSDNYIFNDDPQIYMDYSDRVKKTLKKDDNGIYYYRGGSHDGIKLSQKVYIKRDGVFPRDVWTDIPYIRANTLEYQGFSTQKPERLLKRIILASSNENDLIADFFCGSGTTLAAAEKLKRRWIGCDITQHAIYITLKRLLNLPNSNNLLNWKTDYKKKCSQFLLLGERNFINKKNLMDFDFFKKNLDINYILNEKNNPDFKVEIEQSNKSVVISLKDYIIPYKNFIKDNILRNINKFSDWIDFWAIDFNYNGEIFNYDWYSFRSPKNRKIILKTPPYYYNTSGTFEIMIKVVNIFGLVLFKSQKIYIP
ncbi:MAG: DNA methyltransferase [Promethearchaeota archaeon]